MQRLTAEHAWFDKLTMSALVLSLSKDAGPAVSAVNVVDTTQRDSMPASCAIREASCRR
jgi:hypothetical protein